MHISTQVLQVRPAMEPGPHDGTGQAATPQALFTTPGTLLSLPTAAHWSPPSLKSPDLGPPSGVEGVQTGKPGLYMAGVQEQTFWLTGSKAFAANSSPPLLDHGGGGEQKEGQPLDS